MLKVYIMSDHISVLKLMKINTVDKVRIGSDLYKDATTCA
jgi:hypothetical protein